MYVGTSADKIRATAQRQFKEEERGGMAGFGGLRSCVIPNLERLQAGKRNLDAT
jgi:hypothetical protein